MSEEDAFEKKLRGEEPRALPPEWRGEILSTALGVKRASAKEVFVALLPRPLAIGLAAAWFVILGLRLTMPGAGDGDGVAADRVEKDRSREIDMVAFAERVRVNVSGELKTNGTL